MEIKFNKVKFKNFLCFGSRVQEIELKNGLNIVVGIDKDNDERSNGSGKTSLLETIPFALYGVTHKQIKKSDIINWKNRKNCEVVLEFTKNNDEYTILRGIKPNVLEIYKNNILIDRPPHVRDYQKILDDIIGLNFQSFISIIHSNINSSMPITIMNKPEKRKFMEKIFNLKVYSMMNEICNEKLRNINEKKMSMEKDYEFASTSLEIISNEISSLNERKQSYNSKDISYKKAKKEYDKKLKDYKDLNNLFDLRNTELVSLSIESERFKNILEKIKMKSQWINSKIRNIDNQNAKILEELKKSKEVSSYKEKLDYIISKYGDIDDIDKKILEINERKNLLKINLEKLQIEKEDIQRVLITFESQQNNLKDKIGSLENHSICPLCEQEVKGEIDIVKNWKNDLFEVGRYINESNTEMKEVIKKIDDTKVLIKKCDQKIEKLQKIKDGLSKIKLKISDYNIDENESMLKVYKYKKKKYLSVINKFKFINEKVAKKYNEVNKKIELITEEKNNIEYNIKEIEKLEKDVEILKREVKLEKQMRDDISKQILKKETELQNLKDKKIQIKQILKKNTNTIDYLSFIKEMCKDENIKQFAISSNIPYINERVNYYLSEVGHNFYVLLDNWLDLQIKGPGITNGSYGSLSAGESKSIDLAMQFAFLDVSRIQSGAFIDLLIEDEILDSSIDSIGLPKLINILKFKQREDNLKTFIISHRSEINDLDIDNIYQVVKKNGYSTVEIV
jgi:DNA repair exonuclease SbcCD ATPase subunit